MNARLHNYVVIFGGGIAGASLAKALSATQQVTLVDSNDYFEVPMSTPRSLVDPFFSHSAVIPFAKALPRVRHVRGTLETMTPRVGIVRTPDGQTINIGGDVNVLATGSAFANDLMRGQGMSTAQRRTFYGEFHARLFAAQKIVLVGGGPIGIEVAGEIVDKYPDKQITIVEAGQRILASTSEAAARFAHDFLTHRGVEIITNDCLLTADGASDQVFSTPGQATTQNGHMLEYDLLIWCTGGSPNTAYMRPQLETTLNEHGRVRVEPTLQVVGHDTLFALGDITDLDENKMAWHISGQIAPAAINIRRVLAGQRNRSKLKTYCPKTNNANMTVTLGSGQGIIQLRGLGLIRSPLLTRKIKAEHMLVPRFRKMFGLM
ncbi:FAD-dependent oxidoreductase [Xanthomonas sp. BRIP62418]|uniref:NAD(P)/FAD-dependent oxidoreductase n=1 Tax=Xanthomonas sp. BRIP62418 TaxID=2182391 RepID=UPI000F8E6245|nr:FAD-dependent oxidoreductase [Xanthomonas sp. BRIP62418]